MAKNVRDKRKYKKNKINSKLKFRLLVFIKKEVLQYDDIKNQSFITHRDVVSSNP